MQILEDHNKQLESQLQRLRELLLQVRLEPQNQGSSRSGGGHRELGLEQRERESATRMWQSVNFLGRADWQLG